MKTIIVTGTPCTGKSTLSKKLVKYLQRLQVKLLDVNLIINKHGLKWSYEKSRDTYIIDTKKRNKILIDYITKEKKAKTFSVDIRMNPIPGFLLREILVEAGFNFEDVGGLSKIIQSLWKLFLNE